MCGRFTLTVDPADLQEAFPEFIFQVQLSQRFNIAPSQPILCIPNDGRKEATFFSWGLIPSWTKSPQTGGGKDDQFQVNRMINARAETLAEKPFFRSAYKNHRCLILADGFYEWQARPGMKTKAPHFIRMKSRAPFAFAGLWDRWQSADGSEILSAAIITTDPNEVVEKIHNRMPVILPRDTYSQWLDPAPQIPNRLQGLLIPYPASEMESYAVSPLVNSPGNDLPECVKPA